MVLASLWVDKINNIAALLEECQAVELRNMDHFYYRGVTFYARLEWKTGVGFYLLVLHPQVLQDCRFFDYVVGKFIPF